MTCRPSPSAAGARVGDATAPANQQRSGSPERSLSLTVAAVVVGVGALVATAAPASAHASFVAASPSPGHGLPQAPGAVGLRFSEPLNLGLSRIEVVDGDGNNVGIGATTGVEGDPAAMRRKLDLLRPGQYRVRWVSVSTVDGHSLRGSYAFGIGTGATDEEHVDADPVASEGWLGLVGRWVALVGLALWVGVVGLSSVARRGGLGAARLTRLGRLAPGLALAGTAVSVLSLALVTTGSPGGVGHVLSGGEFGQLRALAGAMALAGFLIPPRLREVHAPLVALAIVAEAASGHAAGSPAPGIATVSFALHLGAVGVWVFAILAALLAPSARVLLRAVWPHAVGAAVAVTLTGALNAALELTGPGDLVSTGYGRTVLAKVGLIVTMAALGLAHQLRHRRESAPERALRRPLRLELGAAGLALAAATALVGFPNPPREADAAAVAAGTDPVLADLASHDALSMAEASGPFVVGITVLPPRPGPVELRVHIVGVEAGESVVDAAVQLSRRDSDDGSATVALRPCGAGCFRGRSRVDEAGAWSFAFSASSTRGPIEARVVAPLPAPDGRAELGEAIATLGRLRSMAMGEELRAAPGEPATVAAYRFSAPDAFDIRVRDRHQLVIDDRSYERAAPGKPWETSPWPGVPFRWPGGYYRTVWDQRAAVRLLGTEQMDGRSTTIISFVRPDLPAWFRLWVGDDGLVRREEMLAEGHLMDRTYSEFNTSPMLAPPGDP